VDVEKWHLKLVEEQLKHLVEKLSSRKKKKNKSKSNMDKRKLQLVEIARRNARGELTPTQLDWWCSKLETDIDEINAAYGSAVLLFFSKAIKIFVLFFMFLSFFAFLFYNR
jgi:hypothetical protein